MSRSTGAPAHRLLMAFCSFLVFVSGIATSLHGQPASKPPIAIVDSATGSRALLYVDVVGTGANRRLVTAGVSPEGRQLGGPRLAVQPAALRVGSRPRPPGESGRP